MHIIFDGFVAFRKCPKSHSLRSTGSMWIWLMMIFRKDIGKSWSDVSDTWSSRCVLPLRYFAGKVEVWEDTRGLASCRYGMATDLIPSACHSQNWWLTSGLRGTRFSDIPHYDLWLSFLSTPDALYTWLLTVCYHSHHNIWCFCIPRCVY